MIIVAGLLVLGGLGLFVGGVLTGMTALYWACVGVCVLAAVLLFLARRGMAAPAEPVPAAPTPPARAATEPARRPATTEAPTGRHAGNGAAAAPPAEPVLPATPAAPVSAPPPASSSQRADEGEPPVEEVEVTDLLLVVDLKDEVLVVDEHPRYHVPGCAALTGREVVPIPVDEARADGFTPCGTCRPDATLAEGVRARRRG